MDMNTVLCETCEEPLILIEKADGETFFACQQCGIQEEKEPDFVNTYEECFTSTYAFAGEGSRPQGYKNECPRLSEGRKKGKANIQMLCQHFKSSANLQKEMISIFLTFKGRKLEAIGVAVFVAVTRNYQTEEGVSDRLTLRQVSSIIGLSVSQIASALKHVEGLMNQKAGNGAITNVPSIVRTVLPEFQLLDPFTNEIITQRVMALTEKIIQVVQRRTAKSVDPNFVTIAAGYLAWQSCFFYQKPLHGHLPLHLLKKPEKISTLSEYLVLARLTVSDTLIANVRRSYLLIYRVLTEMLDKMPWIRPKTKTRVRTLVAQHLEEILQYQELTCDLLSVEAETRRKNEPIVHPTIPRELTAEEEIALDVPELSEKDLPDDELGGYVRSAEEVESLKRWIDSATSDTEKSN